VTFCENPNKKITLKKQNVKQQYDYQQKQLGTGIDTLITAFARLIEDLESAINLRRRRRWCTILNPGPTPRSDG
jgi:hypothetical protein